MNFDWHWCGALRALRIIVPHAGSAANAFLIIESEADKPDVLDNARVKKYKQDSVCFHLIEEMTGICEL